MSSDVDDDQVLPESLQKLEIVPIFLHSQSACKSNNERNQQNPFYSQLSTANGIDERITADLFGPSCSNCESKEIPCSTNTVKDTSNRNWRHRGNIGQCIEHSINKQTHFKHRDREKSQVLSEKKLTILREPILKSIGRSVYHNGNQSKSCCEPKTTIEHEFSKNSLANATSRTWFASKACDQCTNDTTSDGVVTESGINLTTNKPECRLQPGVVDGSKAMIHRIQNWRLDDGSTIDFKSLVNECDNLMLAANGGAANTDIELHKTGNFQVLQANQIASTAGVSGANEIISPNSNIHAASTSAANNSLNGSLNSNSSNSSSCSQQARMNSSNCDVTIDELASYIEFQLHLPKPMSSNVYEAMFS